MRDIVTSWRHYVKRKRTVYGHFWNDQTQSAKSLIFSGPQSEIQTPFLERIGRKRGRELRFHFQELTPRPEAPGLQAHRGRLGWVNECNGDVTPVTSLTTPVGLQSSDANAKPVSSNGDTSSVVGHPAVQRTGDWFGDANPSRADGNSTISRGGQKDGCCH